MNKDNVSLSIIIRTKNSSRTIKRCIESIINQSYNDSKEIIIVDSGSSDNTICIAKSFNCKIIPYNSSYFNYSKALNLGISSANGKYILCVSSHVYLESTETIKYMIYFLSKNRSICTVSTHRKIVRYNSLNKEFNKIEWSVITNHNFKGTGMFNPCSLIRKSDWNKHNFNEKINRAEDADWLSYQIRNNNKGAIIIHNPYIIYDNPYSNMKKEHWDVITVGRYIYPPVIGYKRIIKLLTLDMIRAIYSLNLKRIIWNYSLVFLLIREKIGYGIDIPEEPYNKKINSNDHSLCNR